MITHCPSLSLPVQITWTSPDVSADVFRLEASKDGGVTWEIVYSGSAHFHVIRDVEVTFHFSFSLSLSFSHSLFP